MKPVLILERSAGGLNRMNEAAGTARGQYILGGPFTEFNRTNRNNRVYTADKFLPHLNELVSRMETLGIVYGEYDHPETFDISLSRTSHAIQSISYNESKNIVEGEIRLLSTHWGKEARALVDDGCPIFVSSRAAGVTEANNHVRLNRLFTYDIVADPGFSSARMTMKNLNESFGMPQDDFIQIYDLGNSNDVNKLVTENANDYITRSQMVEYGNHLKTEVTKLANQLTESVAQGKDAGEVQKIAELYENTIQQLEMLKLFANELSEKTSVAVTGSSDLKAQYDAEVEKNVKLEKTVEKLVGYTKLLAEKLDTTISFIEHVAENVQTNIAFTEYVAEHVQTNIEYSQMIAESLNSSIELGKTLNERLDSSIEYVEHVAEHVQGNIKFTEYVAEHVQTNIQYTEYVVEHVEDNIAYQEYIANNLDGLIDWSTKLHEHVTAGAVNEATVTLESPTSAMGLNGAAEEGEEEENEDEDGAPSDDVQGVSTDTPEPVVTGVGDSSQGSSTDNVVEAQPAQGEEAPAAQGEDVAPVQAQGDEAQPVQGEEPTPADAQPSTTVEAPEAQATGSQELGVGEDGLATTGDNPAATVIEVGSDSVSITKNGKETIIKIGEGVVADANAKLLDKIGALTEATKQRKAAETNEPHFFKFMTEQQIGDFKSLNESQQETVKTALATGEYFNNGDVLRLIQGALAAVAPSLDERLVSAIPADMKGSWEMLSESQQGSVLRTARFYEASLSTNGGVENFWRTRNLEVPHAPQGQLISESKKFDNGQLDESQINMFMDRFRNL